MSPGSVEVSELGLRLLCVSGLLAVREGAGGSEQTQRKGFRLQLDRAASTQPKATAAAGEVSEDPVIWGSPTSSSTRKAEGAIMSATTTGKVKVQVFIRNSTTQK